MFPVLGAQLDHWRETLKEPFGETARPAGASTQCGGYRLTVLRILWRCTVR